MACSVSNEQRLKNFTKIVRKVSKAILWMCLTVSFVEIDYNERKIVSVDVHILDVNSLRWMATQCLRESAIDYVMILIRFYRKKRRKKKHLHKTSNELKLTIYKHILHSIRRYRVLKIFKLFSASHKFQRLFFYRFAGSIHHRPVHLHISNCMDLWTECHPIRRIQETNRHSEKKNTHTPNHERENAIQERSYTTHNLHRNENVILHEQQNPIHILNVYWHVVELAVCKLSSYEMRVCNDEKKWKKKYGNYIETWWNEMNETCMS